MQKMQITEWMTGESWRDYLGLFSQSETHTSTYISYYDSNHGVNRMIDLLQIPIDIHHQQFGTTRTIDREDGAGNTKQLSRTIWINHVPVYVTSLKEGTQILIRCCPLKVLQGHNVFGSNNVRKLGYAIIVEVLNALKIEATAEQLREWRRGEFKVSEIHLTHRFPVKSYSMIQEVITHIHRYTSVALRAAYIQTGVGVKLSAPGLEWLFYDKHMEFADKRKKQHCYLEAHAGTDADEAGRLLHRLASKSIRAELKLKDYLTKHGLNTGKAWTTTKVKEVFLSELAALHLGELPSVSQLPRMYRRVKDLKQRTALIMWANGQDIADCYALTKRNEYRKAIKHKLGIDILKDKPVLKRGRFKLHDVFAPSNMLAGFPKWAKRFPQLAFR